MYIIINIKTSRPAPAIYMPTMNPKRVGINVKQIMFSLYTLYLFSVSEKLFTSDVKLLFFKR